MSERREGFEKHDKSLLLLIALRLVHKARTQQLLQKQRTMHCALTTLRRTAGKYQRIDACESCQPSPLHVLSNLLSKKQSLIFKMGSSEAEETRALWKFIRLSKFL